MKQILAVGFGVVILFVGLGITWAQVGATISGRVGLEAFISSNFLCYGSNLIFGKFAMSNSSM